MVFRITLLEVLHSHFAALGQEPAVPLHLSTLIVVSDIVPSMDLYFRDVDVLDADGALYRLSDYYDSCQKRPKGGLISLQRQQVVPWWGQ